MKAAKREGNRVAWVFAGGALLASLGWFGWVVLRSQAGTNDERVTVPTENVEVESREGNEDIEEEDEPPFDASDDATVERSKGTATTVPLTDQREGYVVDVPLGWSVEDRTAGAQVIRADLTRETTGLQIRVMNAAGSPTVDEFMPGHVDRFSGEMAAHWGGTLDVVHRECRLLGRHHGCKTALVHQRPDGKAWFLVQYAWVRDGRAYVMQAGAPNEERSTQEPLLDSVATSFRWVPK
jgi:hypothetical protein